MKVLNIYLKTGECLTVELQKSADEVLYNLTETLANFPICRVGKYVIPVEHINYVEVV